MAASSPQLQQLASDYGVATGYHNNDGHYVVASAETLVAVLAGMGVDASTPQAVAAASARHQDEIFRRVLPPSVVMRTSQQRSVDVHIPAGHDVEVTVELEDGTRVPTVQVDNWNEAHEIGGVAYGEASFALPTGLPLGYHRLRASWDDESSTGRLIVTPDTLQLPARTWGPMVQLYSARSAASWGIGDLADLRTLVDWSARQGAGYVLTNPLHAAEPTVPQEASPYLPTSRRFSHPIYLRVEDVVEYADLPAADAARVAQLRDRVRQDPTTFDRIDRDVVWPAKMEALRLVHRVPRSPDREAAYRRYLAEQKQGLVDFARWMALAEVYGADWRLWDAPLQDPHSRELAAWADVHAEQVEFHAWLQWLLDDQLGAAQDAATAAGMPIGVMGDLAVGVNEYGAETWANPDLYARGVTVGAPPDAYNALGQDWSQPPMRPDELARTGYAPYRALVGTLLRHSGGLRVDHIMGLFRLFWIPAGMPPTEGTYVYYDHEAMVGVLALEAHRAGAVVVGEDLGTVEPYVRDYLRELGILGTSILWWEKNHQDLPLEPQWYRQACMASVTTHDLPPTAGYLEMAHVALRRDLAVLTRPVAEVLAAEEREQAKFLDACRAAGLLPADFVLFSDAERAERASRAERGEPLDTTASPDDAAVRRVVAALYGYLQRSSARLLNVALTDMVGDRRIQNQPGTSWERPNWRIPLSGPDGRPVLLEDALADPRAVELAAVLRGNRAPAAGPGATQASSDS